MNKIAILAFGIADTFCSKSSFRFLQNGDIVAAKLDDLLSGTAKDKLGALVSINRLAETNNLVNPKKNVSPTKCIDVKLCEDNLFHINNEISIIDYEGEKLLFNGNQLDFLLRPEEYDIHIIGVDINGVFIETIDYLLNKGFSVTVYSDCIKPYSKKTILHIKNSNVKFTSIKSVDLD